MKRNLSLIAIIMATVVYGIQLILNIMDFFVIISALSAYSGDFTSAEMASLAMVLALYIFLLAFIVVAFILTILMFKYVNASPEVYAKKKPTTIAAIVFNFLVMILLIISFVGATNVGTLIFSIICFIALVVATVMIIVDLVNEKKKVEELMNVRPVETNATATEKTQEEQNSNIAENVDNSQKEEDEEKKEETPKND